MKNTTLCYIENEKGEYLMLHRVKKQNDLNHDKWIGVGGKCEEGESPEECVCRETWEETGLTLLAENGRVFGSYDGRHFFCDIWLFEQDFDLSLAKLQEGETTDIMFASPDTVRALRDEDKFVPIPYIDEILSV